MKLLEQYSLATGLCIGHQYLTETFYPLEFEGYITLQSGSGMVSKNYPYYGEVLNLILPILNVANIQIVQLGGKDDLPVKGCHHLLGQTNLHQSNYILHHSLCHFGNDSWMSHRGGELGIPLVICFGPTTPENHGPYKLNSEKSIFIESHRFGRRATFTNQENPATISVIPPEQIARAILKVLGLDFSVIARQSIYVNEIYLQPMIEVVPNVVVDPRVPIPGALIVRMDYLHDEAKLAANLQLRKCAIVMNKEIDLGLLARLKPNIATVKVEVNNLSAGWLKGFKKLGLSASYYAVEPDLDKLATLRLQLYDACLFDQFQEPTREDFLKGVASYLNKPLDTSIKLDTIRFRTNKFLLSDDKIYLSKAHWLAGRNTPNTTQDTDTVIDNQDFFQEFSHCYFFLP